MGHDGPQDAEAQSFFTLVTTYLGYAVLFFFGHVRDTFAKLTGVSRFRDELFPPSSTEAPLLQAAGDAFYVRRLKHRINDCWDRPICSRPGAHIEVMDRKIDEKGLSLKITNKTIPALNLGSYNYLGFADDWDNTCGTPVREALAKWGVSCQSAQQDLGNMDIHDKLEKFVARFVGKEDAIVYNMGFGTNSTSIPALMGAGSLIVSDALNHTSLVAGCRDAGSKAMTFKHNDPESLEKVLKEAIVTGQAPEGQPYKPWTKILVMVEGIYSMEGEVCKLKEVVAVTKKYKSYLYVDEAHSIGALGRTGRGVTEHCGVPASDVDILMGTFTKSFGGMGGYIAADKNIVDRLRALSAGALFGSNLSPTVSQQVLTSFEIISGEDGTNIGQEKLEAIKSNANYFREKLKLMGCSVLGDEDSPVIPMMLFNATKIPSFSRECLKRNLAVVVVGAPAVPIYGSRVRFCISAAHTKDDLREALKKIREVCKILNLRYERSIFG